MIKRSILILIFIISVQHTVYAQIVSFTFNTDPFIPPSAKHPNLSVSVISLSAGTLSTNVTTGDYFTDEPYIEASGGWNASNVFEAKYFLIELKADSGYMFSLSNIYFKVYSTAAGPSALSVLVNDSCLITTNMPAAALLNFYNPIAGFDSLTRATIKIAGWNNCSRSTSGNGTLRLDDLYIGGLVEERPPNDSSSFIMQTSFLIPDKLSSLIQSPELIPVFEFVIGDSASGDGVNTVVDSLVIDANSNNQIADWTTVINQVKLISTAFSDTLSGKLSPNTIVFSTPGFEVHEGIANNDTCQVLLNLNPCLNNSDHKSLGFKLDSLQVFCNVRGSQVGHGHLTTPANKLKVQVEATRIHAALHTKMLWKDSLFSITANASDVFGNIDPDINDAIYLEHLEGEGVLFSSQGLATTFMEGVATFSGLTFSGADTLRLVLKTPGFADFFFNDLEVTKPCFYDDFEGNNLNPWKDVNDWAIDSIFPISGNFSLKHNLWELEGTSCIVSEYKNMAMNSGKMVWRMDLFNADFDPSSSNRFWYCLMAAGPDLLNTSNQGYVVGVNFAGTTDSLSLWRFDASGVKTELIVADFDWNENDTVAIEIIREPLGNWQLAYAKPGAAYTYSQQVCDNTYSDLAHHGLVFQYSSTRAGKLWADNIFAGQFNTPPRIKTVQGIADDTLKLEFSEDLDPISASEISNYQLSSPTDVDIRLESVWVDSDAPHQVYLIVNRLKTANYSLCVSKLSDTDGSVMKAECVEFSYAVKALKYDVVFSELMFDSYPATGLPEADYLEIYNRSENPFNLQGWQLLINGVVKTFPDVLIGKGEWLIITTTANAGDFLEYGSVLGLISSTSLTNSGSSVSLISARGVLIDSLFYKPYWISDEEKQDGGWSLEKIDVENFCSESLNWTASVNEKGGTPGSLNSVAASNKDNLAPKLVGHTMLTENSFYFEFSEEVGALGTLLFTPSLPKADSVVLSENKTGLSYYAAESVENNQNYLLGISGFTDLCGNPMHDTSINFIYHSPEFSDIVFSEIMADPSPAVQLPEVEYIEMYNRSGFDINLKNWKLTYQTYTRVFPDMLLKSDAYLLLCPAADVNLLAGYGNTLGLLSSTTLTASGRLLQLFDNSDSLICSVNYNKSWYQNPDKEEGGWSLECIDTDNTCSQMQNWKASESEAGGTPGSINSVNARNIDELPPEINYVKVNSNSELRVEFSESLDAETSLNIKNYVQETLPIDSIHLVGTNLNTVMIYFKNPLKNGEDNILKIQYVSDLCGNVLKDTLIHFVFNIIDRNDIVFSEIMADPLPGVNLPEYEFAELYNRSSKTINIDNWKIAVNGQSKFLPGYVMEPGSFLVLVSKEAESDFGFIPNVVYMTSFPALPNQEGVLQLFDNLNQEVNRVDYSKNWYHDEEKARGGYSLEIIDPDNQCGAGNNWSASQSASGGSPGEINSIHHENIDIREPLILKVLIVDTLILVQFSEAIDALSVITSNFRLGTAATVKAVHLDSINRMEVRVELVTALTLNARYALEVSGIDDYCGNRMKDTLLDLQYHPVQLYEMVINEIMAKPEPSAGLPAVEYIELANNTGYELAGYNWTLSVGNSSIILPWLTVPPYDYVFLYDAGEKLFFNDDEKAIGVYNLPSLPLSGTLKISDAKGRLLCQTQYFSTWFSDDFKAEGGYSLERIDFANPDESARNWQSAISEYGGTPGKINSVYRPNPDITPPLLLRAFPLNDTLFGLAFSEPINYPAITAAMISIENEKNIIGEIHIYDNDYRTIYVSLNSNLHVGVEYLIYISDSISDIAGNFVLNTDAVLALPSKALPNDVVINEILWNPFDGGVDYVELYNKSGFPVNLKQFYLASFGDDGNVKTPLPLSHLGALLFPSAYMVLSENSEIVKQHYWVENPYAFIDVESLPSFPNGKGSVVLLDTSGIVIDYFYYSDEMHFGLLENTKGVSLERVNAKRATNEASNWHSASELSGWGTPGYKNSMYNAEIESEDILSIQPKEFSPDNDGFEDILYIKYTFNEPGYVANVSVFDRKGRLVKKISENELLGVEGNLSWDGLNQSQQKVPIGIYILHFEIFDLQGNVKKYRRVCAVNARFD